MTVPAPAQRQLSIAIKRARMIRLMPYTTDYVRERPRAVVY
jgi:hypothetical protein